jgi:CHAD domain-containing protein
MRIMPSEDDLPLLTYADDLVNKLREMLPAAIKENDQAAIHQSRVATRRLKAAADVFEPVSSRPHRRDFVKTLRKLRKHLGPARDLDVMLDHLDEIKTARLRPGVDWLREQLFRTQLQLRESQAEVFDVPQALARLGAWWGVRQDWADAGDGLNCLICESLHLQLDRFVEYADSISGRMTAAPNAPMSDPHQLRIAGKALRYTLDMAVAGGHKLPTAVGRAFKQMQDALGIWHDFVVLTDRVLKLTIQSEIGIRDSAVTAIILDIAKLSVRRSAAQLARFRKLWNARGETLATTIRRAFPLTHPVVDEPAVPTESKTDPDPVDSEKPPEAAPVEAPIETSTEPATAVHS